MREKPVRAGQNQHYLVFDTETTGPAADPRKPNCNCPIQIGIVILHGQTLEELGSFESLIRPVNFKNINPFSMKVHGITREQLINAPVNNQVLRDMETFLLGKRRALNTSPQAALTAQNRFVLVAHNAAFDIRFLRLMYHRARMPQNRLGENIYCTQKWGSRFLNTLRKKGGKTGLEDQLNAIGVKVRRNAHDALEDARLCSVLLRKHIEVLQ